MRKSLLLVMLMVLMMTGVSMADSLQDDSAEGKHIDAGVEKGTISKEDFFPDGWNVEVAYISPWTAQVSLLGFRGDLGWPLILYGIPLVSADMGKDGISDEGILSALLFFTYLVSGPDLFTVIGGPCLALDYVLFGNTYFALRKNGRVGLFEKHRILDYWIWSKAKNEDWEYGYSQTLGLRLVYTKTRSAYYLDFGANVRVTNKHWRFGMFVEWGSSSVYI